jgi:SSS family solute:Na+ symporter
MESHLLGTIDWAVIGVYFLLTFAVAAWSARQEKTRSSAAGYFLAGRNVGWFVIGASMFASNIGSEHLVGLAGTGAASGVAVGQFEVQASIMILILAWVFIPFYLKSGVYTMPEFMERRYGPAARWYLAVVSIIGYVLTKISVTIFAGAIVFETLMGVPFWTGALIVVIATGIYTIFGGMRAVLYTDMFQMFVLIGGSVAVTVMGLGAVGGWQNLRDVAGAGFFTMWHPMTHPDFPWTGILFGAPILGIWYWCTDQFIVQRVLSAPDIAQARGGAIFAGILKQLPLFIFVIPGVIAYGLVQTGRLQLDKPDQALPALVGALLPAGIRGLVVGGLLAALMSSLSSVFNSCSTLVTWDIYRKLHPTASERHLVWVGQISTGALVGLGLLWIPFMKLISGQIYQYLQSVQAYISPPITAVFLLGVFWKRINAQGAMTTLATGFLLGMLRLVAELFKSRLAPDGWLYDYATINFLHFSIALFLICCATLVLVSLATPIQPLSQLNNLTFQTVPANPLAKGNQRVQALHVGLSLLILGIIAAVWAYFSGLTFS